MAYFNNPYLNIPQYQQPIMPQSNVYQPGNNAAQASLQTQIVVRVPSFDAVKSFYVEPGKPVTFFDDNAPYCYVKSGGTSPVDPPKIRIFELIERSETDAPQNAKNGDFSNVLQKDIDLSLYAKTAEIEPFIHEIEHISEEVKKLRFDIDAVSEKSSKKMVQKARKDADEE